MMRDPQLNQRMTRLTRNRFIKPLQTDPKDLVLSDIQEIPKISSDPRRVARGQGINKS
jgi:hypothetical protein